MRSKFRRNEGTIVFILMLVVIFLAAVFGFKGESSCNQWLEETGYRRVVGCLGVDSEGIVHGRK